MNQYELSVEISEEYDFNIEGIERIKENRWVKNEYPLVYLIRDDAKKVAYVGESTNGENRIKAHLAKPKRAVLTKVSIIGSDKFNKSATLDIESKLIQYLTADRIYKLQNGNRGLTRHNYYQQDLYRTIFKEIWRKLIEKKVAAKSLEEIENSAIFKYSPYKSLNFDQYNSVIEIIRGLSSGGNKTIFVSGSAGTGKTILATYLLKLITDYYQEKEEQEKEAKRKTLKNSDDSEYVDSEYSDQRELAALDALRKKYPTLRIALVIAMTSLRETLKAVFNEIPGLKTSMIISPSEVSKKDYDILLVDEAHRLRQMKNIGWRGAFKKNNDRLDLDDNGTELDWILIRSKQQIFFYDSSQSVRPSDVAESSFDTLLNKEDTIKLTLKSQMRVIGGNDYISFVGHLLDSNPDALSTIELDKNYELLFFDSFTEMVQVLTQREQVFQLSRLIAGYSWFWNSKKKRSAMDIEIEGHQFQWNQTEKNWIHSPNAFQEIGCIHTTQGYDLNYGGIIFGKEITYNPETGKIEIIKENYFDKYGRQGASDEELAEYIVNIYKTIMYRGIRGTFVYACDPQMRAYLKAHLPNYRANFPFRIIQQEHLKSFVNAVPVYDLKAAAGDFSPQQQPENFTWIELPANVSPRPGNFVCQVIGESMNNNIPNGSWCLFEQDGGGSREGKTVLVQHYSIQDSDMGSGYTVKKYHSEKQVTEEGWKHERIVLRPDSSIAFDEIVLEGDELEVLRVVGVMKVVLG